MVNGIDAMTVQVMIAKGKQRTQTMLVKILGKGTPCLRASVWQLLPIVMLWSSGRVALTSCPSCRSSLVPTGLQAHLPVTADSFPVISRLIELENDTHSEMEHKLCMTGE